MKKINRLYRKIEREYNEFRKDMLTANAEGVYASAYKICTIEEIFNLLMYAYEFNDDEVKDIIRYKGNILNTVYQAWLDSDYSYNDLLEEVIDDAMSDIKAQNSLRRNRRNTYAKAA